MRLTYPQKTAFDFVSLGMTNALWRNKRLIQSDFGSQFIRKSSTITSLRKPAINSDRAQVP